MEKFSGREKFAIGVILLIFVFIVIQVAVYLNLFGLGLPGLVPRVVPAPEPDDNLLLREGVVVSASSHNSDQQKIDFALDGDPDSYWHIALTEGGKPAVVTIDFGPGNEISASSLSALPRADLPHQFLRKADLAGSSDGESWEPLAEIALPSAPDSAEWQQWNFSLNRSYRYYRLRILSGHEDGSRYNFYSLAELRLK